MRETQQCNVCKQYALYRMPTAKKTICAGCKEIERAKIVNASVKKGN